MTGRGSGSRPHTPRALPENPSARRPLGDCTPPPAGCVIPPLELPGATARGPRRGADGRRETAEGPQRSPVGSQRLSIRPEWAPRVSTGWPKDPTASPDVPSGWPRVLGTSPPIHIEPPSAASHETSVPESSTPPPWEGTSAVGSRRSSRRVGDRSASFREGVRWRWEFVFRREGLGVGGEGWFSGGFPMSAENPTNLL